jgi:hypothetical protein
MIALALCAAAITSLAATAGAASAAKFYIEGKEVTSKETVNVTSTTPILLEGGIAPLVTHGKIECEQLAARPKQPEFRNKEEEVEWNRNNPLPTIESLSKGTWAKGMHLYGCKMIEPTTCKVATTINAFPTEQTLLGSGEALSYSFTEPAGYFATYAVTGCSVEGKLTIVGGPECKWSLPGTLAATHKCEFTTTSGSKMSGDGEVVLLGTIQFELAGTNAGKKWNMH